MRENRRRVSLVGPVILIGLGIILLLNNLGILAWSAWDVIFRLWPILLIAIGLDLFIGRRSALGSLLVLVLTLAILAGALWLFESGTGLGQPGAGEQITQPLEGATEATVVIDPGAGSLRVEALPESANLVEGVVRVASRERVVPDFSVKNGTANFILRGQGATFGPFVGGGVRPAWDLGLNPGLPLQLDVSLGAGESDVDLTGLMVSGLKMNMGVGLTQVTLPDKGRFQAKIDSAIGQTVVVIPAGMAARVRVSTGIGGSQLPADYRHQDSTYTSPGYESADNRVDLEVNQAIGSITIRHSGGR
jgi:hypothetical protein